MGITELKAKSILQKSGIPGAEYVINPYTGCTHGCVYCYARFIQKFTNHTEPWGTFLDVKANTVQLLRDTLKRKRTPITGEIFLSSVTDCYQNAESKYKLTRGVLELLAQYQLSVSILTKSDLLLRDIDLFKQFKHIKVGLSLMTTDDEFSKRIEPRAPVSSKRLLALQKLHEERIPTYAFISPFLPTFSDIDDIISKLSGKVDEIGVEAINTQPNYWAGVSSVLKAYYPDQLAQCTTLSHDLAFWNHLEQKTKLLCQQQNLVFWGLFRH